MATPKKPIAADPKLRDPGVDPVSAPVEPGPKVETMADLGIDVRDPYPTGDPKTPQTWAEINGFVPLGTGPLAPIPPDPEV
jgi:hypothetical protein